MNPEDGPAMDQNTTETKDRPPETVIVKTRASCYCFVQDCPLHSAAAEMFAGLTIALDAVNAAKQSTSTDYVEDRLDDAIRALEVPLAKLAGRVALE